MRNGLSGRILIEMREAPPPDRRPGRRKGAEFWHKIRASVAVGRNRPHITRAQPGQSPLLRNCHALEGVDSGIINNPALAKHWAEPLRIL